MPPIVYLELKTLDPKLSALNATHTIRAEN